MKPGQEVELDSGWINRVEREANVIPGLKARIAALEAERDALAAANEFFRMVCQKFVDKCDNGLARSVETYRDCKAALNMTDETPLLADRDRHVRNEALTQAEAACRTIAMDGCRCDICWAANKCTEEISTPKEKE
jgi:hypothetical protein